MLSFGPAAHQALDRSASSFACCSSKLSEIYVKKI